MRIQGELSDDRLGMQLRAAIKSAQYDYREYQFTAVRNLLAAKTKRKNIYWQMPQGLGKTLVAHLVILARALVTKSFMPRAIVIVPTTILASQHAQMSRWLTVHGFTVAFLDAHLGAHPRLIRNNTKNALLLISTPRLLWNRWACISECFLTDLRTIIIDEIDYFVVEDYLAETPGEDEFRYHKGIAPLLSLLSNLRIWFLCMTGSQLRTRLGQRMLRTIKATKVETDHPSSHPFLPRIRLIPMLIRSSSVEMNDMVITAEIGSVISNIDQQLRLQGRKLANIVNLDAFIKFAAKVPIGTRCRKWISGEVWVTQMIKTLAIKYLGLRNVRLALFDDIVGLSKDIDALIERLDLTTKITTGNTIPSKLKKLMNLISQRMPKGERGVVFCRYVLQLRRYANFLTERGISNVVAHGAMPKHRADGNIASFCRGEVTLLLMTRDFGCRGLDFPYANFLVITSPLSSAVRMDQEACRIRSNRKSPKDVMLLAYSRTCEESKLVDSCKKLSQFRSSIFMRYDIQGIDLARKWDKVGSG